MFMPASTSNESEFEMDGCEEILGADEISDSDSQISYSGNMGNRGGDDFLFALFTLHRASEPVKYRGKYDYRSLG